MIVRYIHFLSKKAEFIGHAFSTSQSVRKSHSGIQRLGTDVLPPMSQAVVHNNIVYLSGQVDDSSDDVAQQTKNILAKIDKYLQDAGTNKSRILTSTIWLKNVEKDFGTMNTVWNAWIDPDNKPARATTGASLANPKFLVEIQVTATKE